MKFNRSISTFSFIVPIYPIIGLGILRTSSGIDVDGFLDFDSAAFRLDCQLESVVKLYNIISSSEFINDSERTMVLMEAIVKHLRDEVLIDYDMVLFEYDSVYNK